MTTVIIDTRSKEAKRLVDYLKTVKYVKVIDDNVNEGEENYNPDFVEMIKKREKQKSVKLDINNLWK
jgi:hypothetical protein